jgi:hypothetical protein
LYYSKATKFTKRAFLLGIFNIIAGLIVLFSFFSAWVIPSNASHVLSPTDLLSRDYVPLKIFSVGLPIIGLYNIYCGFIRKTSALATWGNVVLCGYLLIAVYEAIGNSQGLLESLTTGYYICLFSFIVSLASIFVKEKPIKVENNNHTA